MTDEEQKRRKNNDIVKELKNNLCDADGNKNYVFISYKSDDWETVLTDIVYRLVKDYGLNVYYDGSFDKNPDSWLTQLKKNMEPMKCKGVLAFIDKEYRTSYATIMELMFSQTRAARKDKRVIPIYLEGLAEEELSDEEIDESTGLDPSKKGDLAKEKKEFDKLFDELVQREILPNGRYVYNKEEPLKKGACEDIATDLLTYIDKIKNTYEPNGDLADIVDTIRKEFGEKVFTKVNDTVPVVPKPLENDTTPVDLKPPVNGTTPKVPNPPDVVVSEETTLKEFARYCEDIDFVFKLREARDHSKKQSFDYLMASLLRGCDEDPGKEGAIRNLAKYNYCTYAVSSKVDVDDPKIGASWYTWTSNSRKALKREDMPASYLTDDGRVKSGRLGENSGIFETLDENMTIGEVLRKYEAGEKGFDTRDNKGIMDAWSKIK